MNNKVYLSLGSNLGQKKQNILSAYQYIESFNLGFIDKKSSFYITPPYGFESDEYFINTVISIYTSVKPLDLLYGLKEIELKLGRVKTNIDIYQSRVIDIDIIDYNNQIFQFENLQIPHKDIENRSFVLFPLKEINPNWYHPISRITIGNLTKSMDVPKFEK